MLKFAIIIIADLQQLLRRPQAIRKSKLIIGDIFFVLSHDIFTEEMKGDMSITVEHTYLPGSYH